MKFFLGFVAMDLTCHLRRSAAVNPRRPLPTTPPPTASSMSSLFILPASSATEHMVHESNTPLNSTSHRPTKALFYPSAATSLYPSTPGTTLTYHLITPQLALLALLPTSVYEGRRGLIEFNVVFFREGVQEICEVEREAKGGR